jgi:hypothetical protein
VTATRWLRCDRIVEHEVGVHQLIEPLALPRVGTNVSVPPASPANTSSTTALRSLELHRYPSATVAGGGRAFGYPGEQVGCTNPDSAGGCMLGWAHDRYGHGIGPSRIG